MSSEKNTYQRRRALRELPSENVLPILIALPHSRLPDNEESMVPRRIVPRVRPQQFLHVPLLAYPQYVLIVEVSEEPLPIGPRMVVLRVEPEDILDECELALGDVDRAQLGQDETTVVPDLVRLEEPRCNGIHQLELFAQV